MVVFFGEMSDMDVSIYVFFLLILQAYFVVKSLKPFSIKDIFYVTDDGIEVIHVCKKVSYPSFSVIIIVFVSFSGSSS